MDYAVREEQQDRVRHLSLSRHRQDHLLEFGQKWAEHCWSTKPDLGQCLLIHRDNVLNSIDAWLLSVAIHGEAVAHCIDAEVSWDATKTENSE